jgi:AdoMet-dependent heme synthase
VDYIPTTAFIGLSYACNLNCKHCYSRNKSRVLSLSISDVKHVIDQLQQMFTCTIILGHGEPFMYPNIFEVISYVKSKGINAVVMTNGTLINDNVIAKLTVAAPHHICVSLDSADPLKHNDIRGSATAWDDAYKAIIKLRDSGFRVKIASTIDPLSPYEYCDLVDMAMHLGINGISLLTLRNNALYSDKELLDYVAAMKDLTRLIEAYPEFIDAHDPILLQYLDLSSYADNIKHILMDKHKCVAAKDIISIHPDGSVCPCNFVDAVAGNVKYQSIAELWNNSELFKNIRYNRTNIICNDCIASLNCAGGCLANNTYNSGYLGDKRCQQLNSI